MRRFALNLLMAYAVAITVVAIWLGCHTLVWRQLAFDGRLSSEQPLFWETMINSHRTWTTSGWIDSAILGVASLDPVQIAGVAGLAFFGSWAIALERPNASRPCTPTTSKD